MLGGSEESVQTEFMTREKVQSFFFGKEAKGGHQKKTQVENTFNPSSLIVWATHLEHTKPRNLEICWPKRPDRVTSSVESVVGSWPHIDERFLEGRRRHIIEEFLGSKRTAWKISLGNCRQVGGFSSGQTHGMEGR